MSFSHKILDNGNANMETLPLCAEQLKFFFNFYPSDIVSVPTVNHSEKNFQSSIK